MTATSFEAACGPLDGLNERCFCVSLDRRALQRNLESQLASTDAGDVASTVRTELFADVPLFVRRADIVTMERVVERIDALTRTEAYAAAISAWMPSIAQLRTGPRGVFSGYDFHLTDAGPRLIEINTNAGGAFLNEQLARAQHACCAEVSSALHTVGNLEAFAASVCAMFEAEWRLQREAGRPKNIAIVDDDPERQPLYAEFRLAQRLLRAGGFDAVIGDPRDLELVGNELRLNGQRVDVVYNRLVDFTLDAPEHAALRQAYLAGLTVVTPNPRVHALLADKRNLTVLSDAAQLRRMGADEETATLLSAVIPPTFVVTPARAEDLWRQRREWFFKPVSGYGSKGVYRGAKITRRVFGELLRTPYVAQRYIRPSERVIQVAGEPQPMKVDVRLYTYAGEVLLTAARMYRGQATNLSTAGGGFAPVFQV